MRATLQIGSSAASMSRHPAAVGGAVVAMLAISVSALLVVRQSLGAVPASDAAAMAPGRLLVEVAGCSHCRAPGHGATAGEAPHGDWLTSATGGWRDSCGAAFPAGPRLIAASMKHERWPLNGDPTPPAPWSAPHDRGASNLRPMCRLLWWLGPKGEPAPGANTTQPQPATGEPADASPRNLGKSALVRRSTTPCECLVSNWSRAADDRESAIPRLRGARG